MCVHQHQQLYCIINILIDTRESVVRRSERKCRDISKAETGSYMQFIQYNEYNEQRQPNITSWIHTTRSYVQDNTSQAETKQVVVFKRLTKKDMRLSKSTNKLELNGVR